MQTRFFFKWLLALSVGVFLIGFSGSCAKPPARPVQGFPIRDVEGDCIVFQHGKIRFAHSNDTLFSGDTLLSSFAGKATISFNDSDYIVLNHDAKIVMTAPDANNVMVMVLHGKVYSNIVLLPTRGSFQIMTPKISTTLRGTAFTIEVDSAKTSINVLEGEVSVMDNDSLCPIQVRGGERAVLHPGQYPCKKQSSTLQELKELVNWVGKSLIRLRKIQTVTVDVNYAAKLESLNLIAPGQATIPADPLKPSALARKSPLPPPALTEPAAATPGLKPIRFTKLNPPTDDTYRSPEYIRQVINGRMPAYQQLYNQAIKTAGAFEGRLKIKFIILPSGEISGAIILSSSTTNAVFDSVLTMRLLQLKFERVQSSDEVTVVYPFDFAIK